MPDVPSPPPATHPAPSPSSPRRRDPPAQSPAGALPPPAGAAKSLRELLALLPRPALPVAPTRVLAGAAAVAGVAVAVVVAVLALRGPPATPAPLVLPRAAPSAPAGSDVVGRTEADKAGGETGSGPSGVTGSSAATYVHAAGAVARPGVYRVRSGGRVADLLDAAGGPAGDADLDQVNLAAKVADGDGSTFPAGGRSRPRPRDPPAPAAPAEEPAAPSTSTRRRSSSSTASPASARPRPRPSSITARPTAVSAASTSSWKCAA
ncbi:MAG TPA: SLBB domain-containing protein [Acidimicrobiales bacterium]|nr:SLBB domain-containing protein [Acidimicrobiales bacterium]